MSRFGSLDAMRLKTFGCDCTQVIDKGGLKYRDNAMHADCFKCAYCNKPLSNEQFASKDDTQFCADCYGQLFAKRCTRCHKPITGIPLTVILSH